MRPMRFSSSSLMTALLLLLLLLLLNNLDRGETFQFQNRRCCCIWRRQRFSRLGATSSDDLKREQKRRLQRPKPASPSSSNKENEETIENKSNSKWAARLNKTREYIARANEEAAAEKERQREIMKQQTRTGTTPSTLYTIFQNSLKNNNSVSEGAKKFDATQNQSADRVAEEVESKIMSLKELTERLEYKLNRKNEEHSFATNLNNNDRESSFFMQNAQDSMGALMAYNADHGQWTDHYTQATRNVVVVFGKKLIRDQVTVEWASRIKALAKMFKTEDFLPSLVCFCGGTQEGDHVSSANAGYVYFRHMCEAQQINLDEVNFFVDSESKNESEALEKVADKVRRYLPSWLAVSPLEVEGGYDQFGRKKSMVKKVWIHLTFVSTEYHLCNLNDIHHRSPRQSFFRPIEALKELKHDQGVVAPSWSYHYSTYPFVFSKDDAVAFMGSCYLLAEELMPLLINLEGVIEKVAFFQRNNYVLLSSVRRSLVTRVEELHRPRKELRDGLFLSIHHPSGKPGLDSSAVDIVLEGAQLSLGKCVDLLRPAGLHLHSVSPEEWVQAKELVTHAVNEIRRVCDPDRPLQPSEWGKLVESDASVVISSTTKSDNASNNNKDDLKHTVVESKFEKAVRTKEPLVSLPLPTVHFVDNSKSNNNNDSNATPFEDHEEELQYEKKSSRNIRNTGEENEENDDLSAMTAWDNDDDDQNYLDYDDPEDNGFFFEDPYDSDDDDLSSIPIFDDNQVLISFDD